MNEQQFQDIVERFQSLEHRQDELRRKGQGLLYNTEGNSHHPLAFASFEAALAHQNLSVRIEEVKTERFRLASQAHSQGFPVERWIKVEGPEVSDDEATGLKLRDNHDRSYNFISDHWSLVLAEG